MIRAAYPESLLVQAIAAAAARNAEQIVADFRAQHAVDDSDMEALAAAARRAPFLESTEERLLTRDLAINAMKADGRYDQMRSGAWA